MHRGLASAGAVCGLLAVVTGAFGAHALEQIASITERQLEVWEIGVRYQFFHALAMLFCALAPGGGWIRNAGWVFLAGVVIFSGTLYGYAITGISVLGAITPIGGVAFLIGWVMLLMGIVTARGATEAR